MVVAPYHSIWADTKLFFFADNTIALAVKLTFAIDEIDSFARLNSSADDIDIIIYFLVEALVTLFYLDLSFKHSRLRGTAQSAYLFDKLLSLFRCDKIRSLNSVDEKSKLGKLEIS